MGLKHKSGIYIPTPSSQWQFNEASSPSVDKGGLSNITFGGSNTFNGDSVTTTVNSGYFNNTSGQYGKLARFTAFAIFKPNSTSAESDILVMASGSGFTANDYTWYLDTNNLATGLMFSVAPGNGDYGTNIQVTPGLDTSRKHWVMFGYQTMASGNRGFLYLKREGSTTLSIATSNSMSNYVTGRNHYLTNSGYHGSGIVSNTYYHISYWENQYLENLALFNTLCTRYTS